MTLMVYDGGHPPLSVSTLVNVTLIDVNDNRPQFTSASYEATVMEDAVVGQTVMTVRAVDADLGLNAQLDYLLHIIGKTLGQVELQLYVLNAPESLRGWIYSSHISYLYVPEPGYVCTLVYPVRVAHVRVVLRGYSTYIAY